MSGMLAELEINLELTKQPISNSIVPFVNNNWEIYKGEVIKLPENMRNILYEVYVDIELANNLVEANIHQLDYGLGYYNQPYYDRKDKIREKAERAIEFLNDWLKEK